MTEINTVLGPIGSAGLGSTLMHEHVFVLSPEIEKTSAEWDEQDVQATAVRRLQELKDSGVDTIVDLTVIGLGRYHPPHPVGGPSRSRPSTSSPPPASTPTTKCRCTSTSEARAPSSADRSR